MIWPIAIWFAFILAHVIRDWYLIEKLKKRPNYSHSTRARIVIGAAYIMLVWDWKHIWLLADLCIFMLTSFWLCFPLLLNIFRKRMVFYLGKTSGSLDPYFLKHPVQFRLALIVSLILCILSIIVIYQR